MNKDFLEERAYNIASEFNDNDLLYIIKELLCWYIERIKQNEDLEKEVE